MRLFTIQLLGLMILAATVQLSEAQSAASLDILGVHLGATRADAITILRREFPNATFTDNTGVLTYGQFKAPQTTFGTWVTFQPSQDYFSYVHLTYDMRDQRKIVAVSRNQVFKPGEMPSVEQTEAALVAKFGKPQIATGAAKLNTSRNLIWHFGTDPSMLGKVPSFSPCLSFMRRAADTLSLGHGVGKSSGDQNLPKCGVWAEVTMLTWNQNPALVGTLEMEIGDLPQAKASIDAMLTLLSKGDGDIRAGQAGKAVKPQL